MYGNPPCTHIELNNIVLVSHIIIDIYKKIMKFSIIIPVHNEEKFIIEVEELNTKKI